MITRNTRGTAVAVAMIGLLLGPAGKAGASKQTQIPPFDVNDLAYLWLAPTSAADVNELITAELTVADGSRRVWPEQIFTMLLQTAQDTSVEGSVRPGKIDFEEFKTDFEKPATWKLVGFRVDPTAPGGHAGFVRQFGSTPQLRMIFQPVTLVNGSIRVHDLTAHLAFSFVNPSPTQFP